ncbi:MAG: phosphate ABC transporter permease PstA [Stenomitos rutilans HA7619-LM2]|nr:phosphate ABC transporter permease PstA [Stenomitos rutilans HA7619-LM2]
MKNEALELTAPLPAGRRALSNGMTLLAFLGTAIALLPLLAILLKILWEGAPHLKWEVLTSLPAPVGLEGVPNGFANAIQGTVMMVSIATLISVPIGLLTAIYLSEFGKQSPLAQGVRFLILVLSGVPSIVVGVFAYAVIVLNFKFSALAGSFALAVIMLPIVVLTAEEALKLVPMQQRLASAALGANPFQTTRTVVATALAGITTGVLLAVARATGETAPLIFTALFTQGWSQGLLQPAPSLSVMIYNYANSAYVQQNQLAWSASVILVGMVLLTNLLSRFITRKRLPNR